MKDGGTGDQEEEQLVKPLKDQKKESETRLEDEVPCAVCQDKPDFPVGLENCVTLDELEEDQCDDDGKPQGLEWGPGGQG